MALVEPLLVLRGVSKHYGAVRALEEIDLDVHEGDVIGLCGDNGAGKSTLIRVLSGAVPPTAGMIAFEGDRLWRHTPRESLGAGIATIYQDLALAPRLSIAQNVFMGAELLSSPRMFGLLDRRRMRREARRLLDRFDFAVTDMDRPVSELSGGQRQAVALARALRWQARLVILDEPTAALGVAESQMVLDLIRSLAAQGVTVILVSHNMDDLIAVTRRVVVLKAGRKVGETPTAALTPTTLATAIMTGEVPEFVEQPSPAGPERWVPAPPRLVRHVF